jgi:hypothetical protein
MRPERGTYVTFTEREESEEGVEEEGGRERPVTAFTFWVGERTTIRRSQGGATDEGYHWEYRRYGWDIYAERATLEVNVDARDCDGGHQYTREYVADGTTPWREHEAMLLTAWVKPPRE